MGRIEDALQKIQARQSEGDDAGARQRSAERLATLRDQPARPAAEHVYSGRAVQVDSEALRRHGLLAPDAEMRRIAEEYRVIKRPLLNNAKAHRDPPVPLGNLVMAASALEGEGKTFTCVNLSLSIAREKDWSVVLVDGDCSKPHLTRLFSAENEPGLLDVLRDPDLAFDDVVMPTDIPGLSIVPSGGRDQHSAELLASRRMSDLCSEISAADAQRMIIFDSSPLLLTTEAPTLGSQVGQIAVVVQANRTPQQDVLMAIEKLDSSKPVGCILNRQAGTLGTTGYYGYGYGDDDGAAS